MNTKARGRHSSTEAGRGRARRRKLESAYERYINDTYWLLAPWKIFDPGVHLAYDGEKPCPGRRDVRRPETLLRRTSGLTPRDAYWLWITRDGRKMVQWQYLLNGAAEAPTTAPGRTGRKWAGSLLSWKPIAGKPADIRFENVTVAAGRDDSLFRPPAVP